MARIIERHKELTPQLQRLVGIGGVSVIRVFDSDPDFVDTRFDTFGYVNVELDVIVLLKPAVNAVDVNRGVQVVRRKGDGERATNLARRNIDARAIPEAMRIRKIGARVVLVDGTGIAFQCG
jgi:hypothetical protein